MPLKRSFIFQELQFEDCSVSSIKAIWKAKESFSTEERAQKRRRIEENSLRYLSGETLHIQAAALRGPFTSSWQNPWRESGTESNDEVQVAANYSNKFTATISKNDQKVAQSNDRNSASQNLHRPVAASFKPLILAKHAPFVFKRPSMPKPRHGKQPTARRAKKAKDAVSQPQLTLVSVAKASLAMASQKESERETHSDYENKGEQNLLLKTQDKSKIILVPSSAMDTEVLSECNVDSIDVTPSLNPRLPSTTYPESCTLHAESLDNHLYPTLPEHQDSNAYSPPSIDLTTQAAEFQARLIRSTSLSERPSPLLRKSSIPIVNKRPAISSDPLLQSSVFKRSNMAFDFKPQSNCDDLVRPPSDENQTLDRSDIRGCPSSSEKNGKIFRISSQHSDSSKPVIYSPTEFFKNVSFLPSALADSRNKPKGVQLHSWQVNHGQKMPDTSEKQKINDDNDIDDDFDLEKSLDEVVEFLSVDYVF